MSLLIQKTIKSNDMQQKQLKHCIVYMFYLNYCSMIIFIIINNAGIIQVIIQQDFHFQNRKFLRHRWL